MTMTHNPTTITAAPGLPFVDIDREFNASAAAVYRAHTDADLYARWVGPRGMELHTCEINATPGGFWSFSFTGDGMPMSFSGVFHTAQPNALLIQTEEFNLAPGQVTLSITRFEETDGRTRMTVREIYPSVEARDEAVATGMEYGIIEGYEKLDEVLGA